MQGIFQIHSSSASSSISSLNLGHLYMINLLNSISPHFSKAAAYVHHDSQCANVFGPSITGSKNAQNDAPAFPLKSWQ
eukprot:6373534-Amphidinium_carterae.1